MYESFLHMSKVEGAKSERTRTGKLVISVNPEFENAVILHVTT